MISTSCKQIASELLARSVAGDPPAKLPLALAEDACGPALFGIFVEGLADRFDPGLCDVYARLFSQAVAYAVPGVDSAALVAHYQRVRVPRRIGGDPHSVSVLSRVTLGADIAVTSVLLDAAKRRFPRAEIRFVAPVKNAELFAADRRIRHVPVEYRRGGLRDRLQVWDSLKELLAEPEGIVIDPDSRLTQLGLLPVCPDQGYHLFDSRGYGGDSERSLPELAAAWAEETMGVKRARPYVGIAPVRKTHPRIAVSLGVGENPAKRLPDPFEEELLRLLASTGLTISIDAGAGGEERARVERAVAGSGAQVTICQGSFSEFAAVIARSRLYVGYDSAGQHVAAARGIPLISIFAGFPTPRMFQRWSPNAPRSTVLRVDDPGDVQGALGRVREALTGGLASEAASAVEPS